MADLAELAQKAGLDANRQKLIARMPTDDAAKERGVDQETVLRQMVRTTEEQAPHGTGPAEGEPVPQGLELLHPDGESAGSLADLATPGRPLILNFGSRS